MVMTRFTPRERDKIVEVLPVEPFTLGSRTTEKWARQTLEPGESEKGLPFIQKSHLRALES